MMSCAIRKLCDFTIDEDSAGSSKNDQSDPGNSQDVIKLSENIYLFEHRTIGSHDNVYEGEVRSSVYGVRPCVIKFAQISEQNVREAEILTKLGNHTNVIAIIQSGTYHDIFEERVYIALDKCHNENLRQYLTNRKALGNEFDVNQAIDFAKQIIVGVMYIHDNNVIHLDLKPSNILISQNLRLIKIADFGLSIIVKSPKSKVFHKRQFGTNGYRPVESFGNGEVSMRTDVFSLGTVLLHLLSNGNDVFGQDEHTFTYNVINGVTNTTGLLVHNPVTTEHLIKCVVSKERCRRPTIWEVSNHPCWLGKEVECNFEYFCDEEIDSETSSGTKGVVKKEMAHLTDIEINRSFLEKMRDMGFNRKPTIVVFDRESGYLHQFRLASKIMRKMHKYSNHSYFEVITFGEYIYIFDFHASLLPHHYRAVDRLEYCDVTATWERMNWLVYLTEFEFPRLAASSDSIFLVDGGRSRRVAKYDFSSCDWVKLPDRLVATSKPAVVWRDGFLYCIGGYDESYEPTDTVERLNLSTMKWTVIANTNNRLMEPVAVACEKFIYVVTNDILFTKWNIEKYDSETDKWTRLAPKDSDIEIGGLRNVFTIDGYLYIVDGSQILQYDVKKDELTIVASFPNMHFKRATLAMMSA